PDVEHELRQLKDFQRRTVDLVHDRLWSTEDPTRRFLVADEVGLGKTLVARGVIAKTIDHLWDSVPRIDVVYICSNSQIARQNLPKLRVGGDVERHHADRLTMLATELRHLEGRKLNFVSFTPGTSFNLRSNGGKVEERVLLYWLLKLTWSSEVRPGPWMNFFRGRVRVETFRRRVDEFDPSHLSADLARDFAESLQTPGLEGRALIDDVRECVQRYRNAGGRVSSQLSSDRYWVMGKLRRMLARAAVKRLEPDLVILDEFQRFKDLMADEGEGAELARELFDHGDARLLLLSATPFKMYTLPDEPEGDDHYRDFVDTVGFLAGSDRAAAVQQHLADLRTGLYADDGDKAKAARDLAQTELRRVMSRTERLATTPDRDGFVVPHELPETSLRADDVRDYARVSAVSKAVGGQEPLEYWRSAPFVLELMEGYQIKQKLLTHASDDPALVDAVDRDGGSRLRWSDIVRYAPLEPGNAKMRGLMADVLDRGAWQLAWIPPSLSYYDLDGPYADSRLCDFTKRLVFSSWAVAPKAIGTVLSYEAERRINEVAATSSRSASLNRYDGPRATGLLNFQQSEGRLTGMPVLSLLYPSVALAEAGDPVTVARNLGATFPLSWEDMERVVRTRVRGLLDTLPRGPSGGMREDADWYWAAGALLDRSRGLDRIATLPYGSSDDEPDDRRRFVDHLAEARALDATQLGRRPEDLEDVLVLLAVGGPGIAALRALSRVSGGESVISTQGTRDGASRMAWSLRNLFNKPELMGIIRGAGRDAYWQDVLVHCVHGGLQGVLDEYVYLLDQAVGRDDPTDKASAIARRFDEATSLRTATQTFTDVSTADGQVKLESHRTRTHLAVRFGRGVAEDDKSVMREGQVREAFNSPFWPFVLASTSVGQEGLDFHHYSHAVVHWNLPSNPVDLEQREGRVHRYQGHAVRKDVAASYHDHPAVVNADNPWACMFELALDERKAGLSDIYPSWVPPMDKGSARIERYVPALPLSRESHALQRLLRTVGAYRMVLGQPRQEDLLRYLGERAHDLTGLQIDLEPGR
ncbi:helicase-related protein, partial [Nocardioides aquaticus]